MKGSVSRFGISDIDDPEWQQLHGCNTSCGHQVAGGWQQTHCECKSDKVDHQEANSGDVSNS